MSETTVSRQMRSDWNERAREDAYYYVAFGRRGQDDDEFFATAADVRFVSGANGRGAAVRLLCYRSHRHQRRLQLVRSPVAAAAQAAHARRRSAARAAGRGHLQPVARPEPEDGRGVAVERGVDGLAA